MRRLLLVAAVIGGAAVGVRVLSAFGLRDTWLTVPVLGALPWAVAGLAVAATAAAGLWLRRRAQGGVAGRGLTVALSLLAVTGAVVVAPRTVARSQPAVDGPEITLAAVNVRLGLADVAQVVEIVQGTGIDVLVVLELTADFDASLRRQGLTDTLSGSVVAPTATAAGGGVYAAGEVEAVRTPRAGGDTPDVTVILPGAAPLDLTTTHPVSPIGPGRTTRWRGGLARVGPAPPGAPAIVAGDLNATLDHATLRRLLARGWRDAAREAGAGLAPTYDGFLDGSPGLPMAIDHVLVNGVIAVRDVRTHDVAGTDHRMLVVDLRVPAAG